MARPSCSDRVELGPFAGGIELGCLHRRSSVESDVLWTQRLAALRMRANRTTFLWPNPFPVLHHAPAGFVPVGSMQVRLLPKTRTLLFYMRTQDPTPSSSQIAAAPDKPVRHSITLVFAGSGIGCKSRRLCTASELHHARGAGHPMPKSWSSQSGAQVSQQGSGWRQSHKTNILNPPGRERVRRVGPGKRTPGLCTRRPAPSAHQPRTPKTRRGKAEDVEEEEGRGGSGGGGGRRKKEEGERKG